MSTHPRPPGVNAALLACMARRCLSPVRPVNARVETECDMDISPRAKCCSRAHDIMSAAASWSQSWTRIIKTPRGCILLFGGGIVLATAHWATSSQGSVTRQGAVLTFCHALWTVNKPSCSCSSSCYTCSICPLRSSGRVCASGTLYHPVSPCMTLYGNHSLAPVSLSLTAPLSCHAAGAGTNPLRSLPF